MGFTCLSINWSQLSKAWVTLGGTLGEQKFGMIGAQYVEIASARWTNKERKVMSKKITNIVVVRKVASAKRDIALWNAATSDQSLQF